MIEENKKEKFKLGEHKLQEIAGSFAVVLPIQWVRNVKICKGDIIEFFLGEEDELILTPK